VRDLDWWFIHCRWSAPALQQTGKKRKTHKNDCNICNRETLKSSTKIFRQLHCIHTTYNIQKHIVRNGIMYKTILIIILLYGILQITVLFDMCTALALGHSTIFKFDMKAAGGARARAQRGSCPHVSSSSDAAYANEKSVPPKITTKRMIHAYNRKDSSTT